MEKGGRKKERQRKEGTTKIKTRDTRRRRRMNIRKQGSQCNRKERKRNIY